MPDVSQIYGQMCIAFWRVAHMVGPRCVAFARLGKVTLRSSLAGC